MADEGEKWFDRFKESIKGMFRDEDPPDEPIEPDNPTDDDNEFRLLSFIREKFKAKKDTKEIETKTGTEKIYLKRDYAIKIANSDKCLKKSMYKEAIDNGFNYGIIELYDFYTTLVKYNDSLYWYIKVLNGKYGLKTGEKFKKGYFNEYSNIRCLVNAKTGKYIYMDENFNTEEIRMISDDEFLKIVFKFKN